MSFDNAVKRILELDERSKKLRQEMAEVRKEVTTLTEGVIHHMQTTNVHRLVVNNNVSLSVGSSKAQLPLSMGLLKTVLEQQYTGRPDAVAKILAAVKEARSHDAGTRTRLKRYALK